MNSSTSELETLRQAIEFNPETGEIWRKENGKRMGTLEPSGYLRTTAFGKRWRVHRLIYWLHFGVLPCVIDHINGKRSDNRIENLRASNALENCQNRRQANRSNKTGLLGVSPIKGGKFTSYLHFGGKNRRLGTFDRPEDAHAVYLEQKRLHHPGCTL